MGLKSGGSGATVQVAKSVPATTYEDDSVKIAGDNTRRRIAAANSRSNSNAFWTSLIAANNTSQNGQKKNTLG